MTIISYHQTERVRLPRQGLTEFWHLVHQHYANRNPRCYRYLAMLALKETAGWTHEQIAQAFATPRGHVSRCLRQVTAELRNSFAPTLTDGDLRDYLPEESEPSAIEA